MSPAWKPALRALALAFAALAADPASAGDTWASSLRQGVDSVVDAASAYAGKAAARFPAMPSWTSIPPLSTRAFGREGTEGRSWMSGASYVDTVRGWGDRAYASLPSWQGLTSLSDRRWLPEGARVDLRQALDAGLEIIPRDPRWYADMGATAAVVGTVVGSASFACAVVATPGGPVMVALAPAACSMAGAYAGDLAVHAGYRAWLGREVDEGAARVGTAVGSVAGLAAGSLAYGRYAAAAVWTKYQTFKGYSKAARSLTRRELRPWRPEVAALRGQGYDIDHVVPVKCGWVMGLAPEAVADVGNLQGLPSRVNRSIGSKGC